METRLTLVGAMIWLAAARTAFGIAGADAPPAPSQPHEITFVQPKETKLENGLRVIVAERPALPLVAAQLLVRSGGEVDPDDRAGTASMAGSLLTKGTEKMSAPQIVDAIESLGGTISSGSGWDASSAGIVVKSDNIEPALTVLADVVLHPTFKQEEIERLKRQRLDGLRLALQQPGSVASFAITRVVFGSGEYGHAVGGTPESLQAMQRDDIAKLYETYYTPDNAVLIFCGNLTLEQGREYAQRFFGSWKSDHARPARENRDPDTDHWKPNNIVIDMPQAGQAMVAVAQPAIKRSSPDYYVGLVANAALGTGFVSRLNREIRIKRGLSYGARSSLEARRDIGPFSASAQTKNESAAEVAKLLQSELKRLATEPVQGDELKSRQAVLTGGFARSMETNQGIGGHISGLATHGLPLDNLNKFIPSINAVTTEDVTAFVNKYFANPPALVVVGKASAFLESLRKDFPETTVIPQNDLDLNRADLVKQK